MNFPPSSRSPLVLEPLLADSPSGDSGRKTPTILITLSGNRVEDIWIRSDSSPSGIAVVVPLEPLAESPGGLRPPDGSAGIPPDGYQTVVIQRLRKETQLALVSLLKANDS